MFEAAALALKAFRAAEWMASGPGAGTVLEVSVLKPVAKRRIALGKLMTWLEVAGRRRSRRTNRVKELVKNR